MSIKLTQLPEALGTPPYLDDERATQDFALVSSDYFFAKDPASYQALLEAAVTKSLSKLFSFIFPSFNPFEWRFEELVKVWSSDFG